MDFLRVIWDLEDDPDGNVRHIAEHGISPEEVEQALGRAVIEQTSRSSGRPLAFGYTDEGRLLAVIFEWVDEDTICPVTAFDAEEEP